MDAPLTLQQLFDTVVSHLRKQGRKSTDETTHMCAYRGSDGAMCAIGALIPDSLYDPRMENMRVRTLVNNKNYADIMKKSGIDDSNLALAEALQETHDCGGVMGWEARFKWIASTFKLEYKESADAK